jgi:hypothetical protein
MFFIKDLKFIKSANNTFAYDGILKKGNAYYITFCHGDKMGDLAIEVDKSTIEVTPDNIKKEINELLGCDIKKNDILFINPCHPYQVRSKYLKSLIKNKIFLFSGRWEEVTASVFVNKYKKSGYYPYNKRKGKVVSMIVGADSEFPSISKEIDKLVLNTYKRMTQ